MNDLEHLQVFESIQELDRKSTNQIMVETLRIQMKNG